MPEGQKYKIFTQGEGANRKVWKINDDDVADFQKDMPQATQAAVFQEGDNHYVIPVGEVKEFVHDKPNAKLTDYNGASLGIALNPFIMGSLDIATGAMKTPPGKVELPITYGQTPTPQVTDQKEDIKQPNPPGEDELTQAANEDKVTFGDRVKNVFNNFADAVVSLGAAPVRMVNAAVTFEPGTQAFEYDKLKNNPDYQEAMGITPEGEKPKTKEEAFDENLNTVKNFFELPHQLSTRAKIESGTSAADQVTHLASGLASFAPQLAAASATGGASFLLGGYESGVEQAHNAGISPEMSQFYGLAVGTANKLLMGLNLTKIFGKIAAGKISQYIGGKALDAALKESGGVIDQNVTARVMANVSDMVNRFRMGGTASAKSFVSNAILNGGNVAAQLGSMELVNLGSGSQEKKFDVADMIVPTLKENLYNTLMFSGMAFMGGAMHASVNSAIQRQILRAKDPTEVGAVLNNIDALAAKGHVTPEQAEVFKAAAQQYSGMSDGIPATLDDSQKSAIMDHMVNQQELLKARADLAESVGKLDPQLQDNYKGTIAYLDASIESLKDRMTEVVRGEKYKYSKTADGKYWKQMEDGDPEPISRHSYEINKAVESADMMSREQDNPSQAQEVNPLTGGMESGIDDNKPHIFTFEGDEDAVPDAFKPYITDTKDGKTTVSIPGKDMKENFNEAAIAMHEAVDPSFKMPEEVVPEEKAVKPSSQKKQAVEPRPDVIDNSWKRYNRDNDIKVKDLIGKESVYDYNGTQIRGKLITEGANGQTVSFEGNDGRIYEIGQTKDIQDMYPDQIGLRGHADISGLGGAKDILNQKTNQDEKGNSAGESPAQESQQNGESNTLEGSGEQGEGIEGSVGHSQLEEGQGRIPALSDEDVASSIETNSRAANNVSDTPEGKTVGNALRMENEFTSKYKVKLEDVISRLKDEGRLIIDCA
jgi:hypothetical protein